MPKTTHPITVENIQDAVERGGSIRAAAQLLQVSYTSLQWWLARNGYEVVKVAKLRKRPVNGEAK